MHHVAVLSPRWNLLEKILSGEKTVESRWLRAKSAPWDKVRTGDTLFFKESGKPVMAQATVAAVEYRELIGPQAVEALLSEYTDRLGIADRVEEFLELKRESRYCVLIRLTDVQEVAPFHIDKAGFGAMAAWLTVRDIREIKLPWPGGPGN